MFYTLYLLLFDIPIIIFNPLSFFLFLFSVVWYAIYKLTILTFFSFLHSRLLYVLCNLIIHVLQRQGKVLLHPRQGTKRMITKNKHY